MDFWEEYRAKLDKITERWIEERMTPAQAYETVMDALVQQYFQEGRQLELVRRVPSHNYYCTTRTLKTICDNLCRDHQINHARALWQRVLKIRQFLYQDALGRYRTAQRKDNKLEALGVSGERLQTAALRYLDERRAFLLEGLQAYVEFLEQHGSVTESAQVLERIAATRDDQLPDRKIASDPRAMEESVFWQLIEEAREGSDCVEEHAQKLAELLEGFRAGEVAKFNRLLHEKLGEARRYDLWAISSIVCRSCSEDRFDYFRCWLVLQGRQAFECALADPVAFFDCLAPQESYQAEELLSAAQQAYASIKQDDLPKSAFPNAPRWKGVPWNVDELPRLYPTVYERFG
jgi:hypothetical protein